MVFVRISSKLREGLFSRKIVLNDGSEVVLFVEKEHESVMDVSFSQNVHIGEVVAVGSEVKEIQIGDTAIIDYLVDRKEEIIIDYIDGDKIVSVLAVTTYHKSNIGNNTRRFANEGDYKEVSQIYGVLRNNKIYPIEPYIFIKSDTNTLHRYTATNISYYEEVSVVEREVLAAYENANAKEGEVLILRDIDIFNRTINGKEISVIFNSDVKLKRITQTDKNKPFF